MHQDKAMNKAMHPVMKAYTSARVSYRRGLKAMHQDKVMNKVMHPVMKAYVTSA